MNNISFRELLVSNYLLHGFKESCDIDNAIKFADEVIAKMQSKKAAESSEWVELKHPEHDNIVIQDGDEFSQTYGSIENVWVKVKNYYSLPEKDRKFGENKGYIKFR